MFVFDNVLTAGTVLVRDQIESQNYTPSGGLAGWAIQSDGDAFFNNVFLRGSFSTGVAPNARIEIPDNQGEIQFYSGLATEVAPGRITADINNILPALSLISNTRTGDVVPAEINMIAGSGAGDDPVTAVTGFLTVDSYSGIDPLQLTLQVFGNGYIQGFLNVGDINCNDISCNNVNGSVFNTSGGSALGNALIVAGGQMNAAVSPPTGAGPGAGTAWWNNTSGTNYRLSRTTSSRRYKENICDLDGYTEDQILSLVPRWYQRNDHRDYTQEDEPLIPVTSETPWVPGFIAEEADQLGLVSWVSQDADGRPDSFSYGEFAAVAHQYVLRAQAKRIAELEARLERLEGLINGVLETGTLSGSAEG